MLQYIHTYLIPIKTLFKIDYESQARAMDTAVSQYLQRTGAFILRPGIASMFLVSPALNIM